MAHPNEQRIRDAYAAFATGNLQGYLDYCTDDITFNVPGNTLASGTFTKKDFGGWIMKVVGATGGSFHEDILDLVANDDRAIVMLRHYFDRDGRRYEYRTAHIYDIRGGQLSRFTEHPGSVKEFEEAWKR